MNQSQNGNRERLGTPDEEPRLSGLHGSCYLFRDPLLDNNGKYRSYILSQMPAAGWIVFRAFSCNKIGCLIQGNVYLFFSDTRSVGTPGQRVDILPRIVTGGECANRLKNKLFSTQMGAYLGKLYHLIGNHCIVLEPDNDVENPEPPSPLTRRLDDIRVILAEHTEMLSTLLERAETQTEPAIILFESGEKLESSTLATSPPSLPSGVPESMIPATDRQCRIPSTDSPASADLSAKENDQEFDSSDGDDDWQLFMPDPAIRH